ncbi:YesL family protein [Bacillus taeanensis]|nr:DUF624 domain-containing protein [Bacillus taeanensis]
MNGVGGFYRISEWVMRFTGINLLWLFFNLPIVFIVMGMIAAEKQGEVVLLLVFFILLAPFLFFPATAAMFASVRDWTVKEESTALVKLYWTYYKENYKKSMVGGLILTAMWSVWGADYYYFSQESIILMFTFIVIGAVLFVFTINYFSINAHYHLKLGALLKKAMLITIGSPLLFFTVFITSSIILYVSLSGPLLIIVFASGSLIAFLSFSAFYRMYLKLTMQSIAD